MADETADATVWVENEPGPTCTCGFRTFVKFWGSSGLPVLFCFAHTREAAATFALPRAKPAGWPALSNEQMAEVVQRGRAEHGLDETDDDASPSEDDAS